MQTKNQHRLAKAGIANTYWGKKILAAEKRGRFTDSNKKEAKNWVTCACGKSINNIELIPREGSHEPLDNKLQYLGMQFDDAVEEDDYNWATSLLIKIETRANKLFIAREKMTPEELEEREEAKRILYN